MHYRLCPPDFLDFEQTLRLKLITVTQREKVYGILNRPSCQKTGLSVHTLRYYEKEGLLPFVRKTVPACESFPIPTSAGLNSSNAWKPPACTSKVSNSTSTGTLKAIQLCNCGWICSDSRKSVLKSKWPNCRNIWTRLTTKLNFTPKPSPPAHCTRKRNPPELSALHKNV